MNRGFIFVKLFFITMLFCPSCKGQNSTDDLQNRISELMQTYDATGVSVAVVKNNQLCYHKSFGYNPDYQNPDLRNPIKDDDVIRIASISKTFVATAIMQLVEKKEIDLDADINKYLSYSVRNPYFPETPITVRMLLAHRSSIKDYQYSKYRNSLVMFSSDSLKSQMPFFGSYKPGTQYNYTNYGYSLLGAIIESVSHVRFDDYIENNILKPLGIYGSYNVSKLDSNKFVWAKTYNEKSKKFSNSRQMYKPISKELEKYVLSKSTGVFSPAGGLILSVPDLAKYMMMHINYGTYDGVRILSKESEEQLWKPWPKSKHGLGFHHSSFQMRNVDLIGHQGGAYGVHSTMFFNPKEKYGIIVICNGCNSGHTLDTQILKELYYHFIR